MKEIQELENKIKEISDIYNKEDGLLKYQYEILNKLFEGFAKKGTYFLMRRQNDSGKKKNFIFVGADNYFETGFWKFDKKVVPYNQNFTIPINIVFFKNGTFSIGTTLQSTKKEVQFFEDNILKKIHDKIPNFKETGRNFETLAKKEEGRIAYSTEKMSDLSKIEEYITIISEVLSKIDGVEKVSDNEFFKIANKRINYISENKNLIEIGEDNINSSKNNIMPKLDKTSQLLNSKKQIILYGPPGTGKTYNIENIIENHSGESYSDLKNEGRVEFITFHQSFSYEEFIEGIKPDLDGDSGEISYKIEDGIFKKIVNKAKQKEINNFDESYKNLLEAIEDSNEGMLILKTKRGKEFGLSINSNENLNLYTGKDKTKQGVLTKEKIQVELESNERVFDGWESYIFGVKEYLENKCGYTIIEKLTVLKNYYLIIDEINRGNISKIFGELITLLEADKRLGEENEIITKLPYSKEDFGIPSNLFIVATMNTSDKSIVSLDTALRRRFGFKEMLPDYSLEGLNKDIEGINLAKLLQKINNRIEYLIDKDHLIGHSYFLKTNNVSDLKLVVYNEILPLLEEYFYGEEEKIRQVLGSKLFEKKKFDDRLFENKGDFENDDNQYEINKNLNNDDFINALKNIIKSNEEN